MSHQFFVNLDMAPSTYGILFKSCFQRTRTFPCKVVTYVASVFNLFILYQVLKLQAAVRYGEDDLQGAQVF